MPSKPVVFEHCSFFIYIIRNLFRSYERYSKECVIGYFVINILTYFFWYLNLVLRYHFDSKCSLLRWGMYLISKLFLQS